MKSDLLHVISVIFNPVRWDSRVRLFNEFIEHMLDSNVNLTIVECGFGDRPYSIPESPNYNTVRVRSNSVSWTKENLLNIGISRLPEDWKYVAWLDGDIKFRHKHWASETVHMLQQYPIIQPWASCYDLGPNGEHLEHHRSFAFQHWHRRVKGIGQGYEFAHPGYAWAARRDTLDKLGGLLESGVLGAGDHHMALALIGKAHWSFPGKITEAYKQPILQWQSRANNHVYGRIGHLNGTIEHSWHGPKKSRKYIERWDILTKHQFDPFADMKKNVWGVLEFSQHKPELIHDVDRYMRQRNEDSSTMD